MQVTPRYGDQPVMRIESIGADAATPFLRQRARLAELVATIDDGQWATPSRCDGWSVQDVIAHLVGVNQFWVVSIGAGASGEPSRYLANFDPVATPAAMVAAARGQAPAETLERFVASNEALAELLSGLDDAGWTALAEAPTGHVPVRLVVLHGLWDAWIHERDIAVPLGLPVKVEPDEVAAALAYVAALGPAFSVSTDAGRSGALELRATDPDVRLVIEVDGDVFVHDGPAPDGAVVLTGHSVDLLEALSWRAPLPETLDADDRWLIDGLGAVFDQGG